MKFHCDRCKTKYSISDDRVRGKILKIRCKNCSAVITVREHGAEASKPNSGAGKVKSEPTKSAKTGSSTRAAADQKAGQDALAGAFQRTATDPEPDPGRSGASAPPVSLEAEWYLSKDGEQEGPFDLQEARAWVQAKEANDELHCWSEGYDDWLPTDKVSHFRSLRRQPSGGMAGAAGSDDGPTVADEHAGIAANEDTPRPLFAATMAAVESQTPGAASADEIIPQTISAPGTTTGPFDSLRGPSAKVAKNGSSAPAIPVAAKAKAVLTPVKSDDGPNLDFEIGEASRVVDLPALMASRANAPARPAGAIHAPQLPGMAGASALGRGSGAAVAIDGTPVPVVGSSTGPAAALPNASPFGRSASINGAGMENPAVLMPATKKKRRGLHVPLIATVLLVVAAAGAMIYRVSSGHQGAEVRRGRVGGSGNLAFSFSGDKKRPTNAVGEPQVEDPVETGGTKTGPRIRKNNTGGTKTTPKNDGTGLPTPTRDPNEVDLGSGTNSKGPTGPLDGDDLMRVYRKNQIAIKMCYERSLKKNPLLKVPKTWVDITVGLDGRVSAVSIPSLAGVALGSCMRSRIARWKFRTTTEVFSSRFPVVFDR